MPSCTRAPPESLMKTNGMPVFSDCSMISATLMEWTSPAEPPDDREILAGQVDEPAVDRSRAGDHAVGRQSPCPPCRSSVGAMLGEQADLLEAARIDQGVDPLAGRQLARPGAASPARSAPPPSSALLVRFAEVFDVSSIDIVWMRHVDFLSESLYCSRR